MLLNTGYNNDDGDHDDYKIARKRFMNHVGRDRILLVTRWWCLKVGDTVIQGHVDFLQSESWNGSEYW